MRCLGILFGEWLAGIKYSEAPLIHAIWCKQHWRAGLLLRAGVRSWGFPVITSKPQHLVVASPPAHFWPWSRNRDAEILILTREKLPASQFPPVQFGMLIAQTHKQHPAAQLNNLSFGWSEDCSSLMRILTLSRSWAGSNSECSCATTRQQGPCGKCLGEFRGLSEALGCLVCKCSSASLS